MNLRARPVKEAFGLLDQYMDEKEKQCLSHNETTKTIEKKIVDMDKQLIMIKYGVFILIVNILATTGNIILQLLKKG